MGLLAIALLACGGLKQLPAFRRHNLGRRWRAL
jgi:hypothetical protein